MPDYLNLRGHQVYSYEWDNNGEAVVLLHGGLSQTSHWDYVLAPDLEPDFHLFAYDRTGHGYYWFGDVAAGQKLWPAPG